MGSDIFGHGFQEVGAVLESAIERRMCRELRRRGAIAYKFVSPGQGGVPDRLVLLPGGRCAFVELKTETGRLSELQKCQIERIKALGHRVYVVRGMQEALNAVEEMMTDGV